MTTDKRAARQPYQPRPRHALPDAGRASPEALADHVQKVSTSSVVSALLEAVDAVLLVLDEHRQIVAFNDRVAGLGGPSDVIGLRPGDALRCVNAQGPGGCGTTPACETCGALSAVLRCQASRRAVEAECLLRSTARGGTSLEFNVRAAPLLIEETSFTVISLRDISSEKRRHALEQIFFHDVLNTLAGLRGWTLRLRRSPPGDPAGIRAVERIDVLSRQVEREIRDHRALMLAESGALVPSKSLLEVDEFFGTLEAVFAFDALGEGRRIEIEAAPGATVHTDGSLLLRVLVNMVRNALEAVPPGGSVRVWCDAIEERSGPARDARPEVVRFNVWNDGVIPPAVQAGIFQRSFSTKADRGRGLGTYGMKLLGERILGGEVTFTSTPASGTVFSIGLPAGPRQP